MGIILPRYRWRERPPEGRTMVVHAQYVVPSHGFCGMRFQMAGKPLSIDLPQLHILPSCRKTHVR